MDPLISDNFIWIWIASSGIIFLAFFVRSLTGFGSALVSVPLLALLFDLKVVVPLEAMLEIGLSVLLLRSVYRDISKAALGPLIIGAVIGSLVGTYILSAFADVWLKRALGIGIIIFAWQQLAGNNTKLQDNVSAKWGLLAGTVGGIFGGIFGTSGPPYVLYLSQKLQQKSVLRASLIGLFTFDYSWRVIIFASTGLIDGAMVQFALYLTPALALGAFLGHRIHFQLSEDRFRQVVALILTGSGILLLLR